MRHVLTIIVPLAVAAICGTLAVVNSGPATLVSTLQILAVISAIAFVAGLIGRIRSQLVLASVWVAVAVAWVSAIFLDVTTPSALSPINLQQCTLGSLSVVAWLAASWVLTGPCVALGTGVRRLIVPAHSISTQPAGASLTHMHARLRRSA